MYPLFETIKVLDGVPQNLNYHQQRFERSYFQWYQELPELEIHKVLKVPTVFNKGVVKCRMRYNKSNFVFSFQDYIPKKIETLKLIHNNTIDYALKYTDRSQLGLLSAQKENCDEIIIVKRGLITDSSYSNLVFFNGHRWITPAKPLLAGTKREQLLQEGKIQEAPITVEGLVLFLKFKLINAMLDFDEQPMIDISAIKK